MSYTIYIVHTYRQYNYENLLTIVVSDQKIMQQNSEIL